VAPIAGLADLTRSALAWTVNIEPGADLSVAISLGAVARGESTGTLNKLAGLYAFSSDTIDE
jgi:hypothetical protein